jgi:hypothetical protein
MRRHHIWFLIAFFWLIDTILTATHRHWPAAALPGAITLIFIVVGIVYRRRERIR